MKRLVKYLLALVIVLVCIYLFWLWLQYKGATVIKQTTASIITELQTIEKLETVTKTFTKTIEGEQALASLVAGIGVDDIINNALFKDKIVLTVQGELHAGYIINNISTGNIDVSRDGTITLILGEPEIFGITYTGSTQHISGTIVTQKDIQMENKLREKAGELMIQEALSGTILQEAKANAQNILQNLFLTAGIQIKEVIIK